MPIFIEKSYKCMTLVNSEQNTLSYRTKLSLLNAIMIPMPTDDNGKKWNVEFETKLFIVAGVIFLFFSFRFFNSSASSLLMNFVPLKISYRWISQISNFIARFVSMLRLTSSSMIWTVSTFAELARESNLICHQQREYW